MESTVGNRARSQGGYSENTVGTAITAGYMNEEKFLASFFLKTFPTDEDCSSITSKHPGSTMGTILQKAKLRPPTLEQTAAYKFFLRHQANTDLRNFLEKVYDAMGWEWGCIGMAENQEVIN